MFFWEFSTQASSSAGGHYGKKYFPDVLITWFNGAGWAFSIADKSCKKQIPNEISFLPITAGAAKKIVLEIIGDDGLALNLSQTIGEVKLQAEKENISFEVLLEAFQAMWNIKE